MESWTGCADTPEKMERYGLKIYNKANEMDTLRNEEDVYTKIDTNRIPYNFNTLSVNAYFDDCAEDLSIEPGVKESWSSVFQLCGRQRQTIADAEQIKRVIHNMVNNSQYIEDIYRIENIF